MGSRQEKDKAVNVQVLLRCRPFNEDEVRTNAPQVVTCNEYQREVSVMQTVAGKQMDRVFTFDKVFGPSAKQKELYDQAVVPIVNEVLEGFNCTIFAYGQTGTGKTYTMEGECRRTKNGPQAQLPPDAGVIPRAVKQIFDTLEGQHAEYSVKVTFIELYNEEITDLLAPEELTKIVLDEKQKKSLLLMEDGKGGVLVRGLEEEIVKNTDEIFSLLERGTAKRRTAETLLNKQSSRSHSLFTITIHIKEATPEGEELIKCGKLNLVDLAGSENISRSGARDGRAREAGEINKSLLTLGRVITALVEHLGHIPYRDSKLTRLLRDSLGGRTKTCIIATVSPSVHCLEETLSTLDYAHRAKNIKNRPEINQKMMKSALIKDLYGEIDRLKAEVYACREKVGIYIPKERYYQEESERKAMAEQIEQMTALLEANQKQIDELQAKYASERQHSDDLNKQLEATERSLDHTSNMLSATREDLKKAQYNLKEKDFIIAEQLKAENALTHQACVLRSDLEKSISDNASLYAKIAREDKIISSNHKVAAAFKADLVSKLGVLRDILVSSIDKQSKHLQSVETICDQSLDFHDKAISDLRNKVLASKYLCASHIEGIQNVVRLHKANSNAAFEDMSSMASTNCCSLDHLLSVGEGEASTIFGDLLNSLSTYGCEVASFSTELRQSFSTVLKKSKEMSSFVIGELSKFSEEALKLQNHSDNVHSAHVNYLADFEKAYEDQSRMEEQKLVADMTNLLSSHMLRQKELVSARLNNMGDAAVKNKAFFDEHTSKMVGVTNDAKRKWEEISQQVEQVAKDGSDFTAAKHCRLEPLLQQCVSTADTANEHWKRVHASVSDLTSKQKAELEALARCAIESNELHDAEIASALTSAENDTAKRSNEVLCDFDSLMERERNSISGVVATTAAHSALLGRLHDDHSSQVADINMHSEETFQHSFKDYEPSGSTPVRAEPDVPSKVTIESLRAMPIEALMDEYRENHPYESGKDPKPTLIPRPPLAQLNCAPDLDLARQQM